MSLHKLKLFAMTVFTLAFLGGGAGLLASRPAKVGELHAATVPADDDNDEQAPDKPKEKVATPKTKDRAADKTPSERELRASLSKKVEYKGEEKADTTLGDVLDQLTKLHGIPFIIDTDAFKRDPTDERPGDVRKTVVVGEEQGPIPPMKTSLRNVLRIVLGRVNATYLIRQDYIEITTESAVRRELELPDRIDLSVGGGGGGLGVMGGGLGALGGGGGMLGGVGTGMFYHPPVPPLIHDEFTKEPLNTVVERIAESANVNIIIDIRVDKKAIAPVTGRFRNVPVETALELLGDQADLGVVKRGHVYYLTSAENAERMRKAKK